MLVHKILKNVLNITKLAQTACDNHQFEATKCNESDNAQHELQTTQRFLREKVVPFLAEQSNHIYRDANYIHLSNLLDEARKLAGLPPALQSGSPEHDN